MVPALPGAQQLGGIDTGFGKLLMAHLSDPDSGCLPVADERFSHSFPYAFKCQRKCPSGSNYRCSSGGTAALLSNTWNWQQAGKRRHQTLLAAPSHLPEQLIGLSAPGLPSAGAEQRGANVHWDEPRPIATHCSASVSQIFPFPAETKEDSVSASKLSSHEVEPWMDLDRFLHRRCWTFTGG